MTTMLAWSTEGVTAFRFNGWPGPSIIRATSIEAALAKGYAPGSLVPVELKGWRVHVDSTDSAYASVYAEGHTEIGHMNVSELEELFPQGMDGNTLESSHVDDVGRYWYAVPVWGNRG